MSLSCRIRNAKPEDVNAIHALIGELAEFEKAPHEFVNTPEKLLKDGFGDNPLYMCFVAEVEGQVAGMSFCYVRYSTWKGKVLYLEDLIVKEEYRGKGIGTALFAHTIAYAREHGYFRLQWQVLDWNEPAIAFYRKFSASFDPEWLNAWVDV